MSEDSVRARRGLTVYFAMLFVLSVALEWRILATGDPIEQQVVLIALLMWSPAVASLIARIALKEGIRDVSFRWPRAADWRVLASLWLFPVAVGVPAYGAAWLTGLASMAPPEGNAATFANMPALLVVVRVLLNLVAGTAIAVLLTAGEEIGWRGYMLTRLFDAGVRRPVLVSGVIWGAWHLPLILSGQYASSTMPALSAALFLIGIIPTSYLFAWSRLRSGSVWPAIVGHASWNAVIQNAFDRSTAGPPSIWVGESGVLVVIINAVVVALLVRGQWPGRRTPRDEPATTIAAIEG